jgi:hypothetical protein
VLYGTLGGTFYAAVAVAAALLWDAHRKKMNRNR